MKKSNSNLTNKYNSLDSKIRRLIILSLVIGLVFLGFTVLPSSSETINDKEESTNTILKNYEKGSVAAVEEKISSKKAEALRASNAPVKDRFISSIVLGDSIAEGITDYSILTKEQCIGTRGQRIDNMSSTFDSIKATNPKHIFLNYGMNDITYVLGNADKFYNNYKTTVEMIKKALPTAKIYINCLLPVSSSIVSKKPSYKKYNDFNAKLKQLSKEEGCTYIDNIEIFNSIPNKYEPDGIHPTKTYYKLWVDHMMEVAGL
ncbi:MAG: GDSL-type esterase/lipase family protein [Thomasclavelia sp.]|nr:GDSL-type esterase/lipase family protein [Thomasclavelia sp.]